MAVEIVLGATESGKSTYVEKILLRDRAKKIVFDPARCFTSGQLWTPPVFGDLKKAYRGLNQPRFFYVNQPGRGENRTAAFDRLISWATALGRAAGPRADLAKRVALVCDEADRICEPTRASAKFEYLINEGRHDNVDSIFICRDPNALFIDARKNMSTMVTFINPLAKEMPFFRSLIGAELAARVATLPKYHHLTWKDNWTVTITDNNGKIYFKQEVSSGTKAYQ